MADDVTSTENLSNAYAWDFFLSHAGADLEVARRLKRALAPYKVFLDDEDIQLGDEFDRVLAEALRASLITVVLVSPKTEKAFYQREEVAVAIQTVREDPHTRRVVPVYLNEKTVPPHVQFGLKLKHGLCVPDPTDLTAAERRLEETLRLMRGFEVKKEEVVVEQRAAIERIERGTGAGDVIAGLGEVTRFVRPLMKTLLALFVTLVLLLVVSLLLPQFEDVRALLATVLGSLCALVLASLMWLTARSLSYAQRIAEGRINGG